MHNYLSALSRFAQKNGFKLLEKNWLGSKEPHRFLHEETGKLFSGKPTQLRQNGFPRDLRSKGDKLLDLARIAKEAGFTLLEDNWLGTHSKHRFIQNHTDIAYQGCPSKIFTRGFPKDIRSDDFKQAALSQFAQARGFTLIDEKWLGGMRANLFVHVATNRTYIARAGSVMGKQGFPKHFSKVNAPI